MHQITSKWKAETLIQACCFYLWLGFYLPRLNPFGHTEHLEVGIATAPSLRPLLFYLSSSSPSSSSSVDREGQMRLRQAYDFSYVSLSSLWVYLCGHRGLTALLLFYHPSTCSIIPSVPCLLSDWSSQIAIDQSDMLLSHFTLIELTFIQLHQKSFLTPLTFLYGQQMVLCCIQIKLNAS